MYSRLIIHSVVGDNSIMATQRICVSCQNNCYPPAGSNTVHPAQYKQQIFEMCPKMWEKPGHKLKWETAKGGKKSNPFHAVYLFRAPLICIMQSF